MRWPHHHSLMSHSHRNSPNYSFEHLPRPLLLIHAGLNHPMTAALGCALGVALADFTYALVALSAGSGLAKWIKRERRQAVMCCN